MPSALARHLKELRTEAIESRREIAELHRRMANVMRPGKVTKLDAEKGLVKITYGKDDEGKPVETPWIRWSHRNGKIKEWMPPSVGEQLIVFSPGGEIGTMSWAFPGGFQDSIPKNHNKDAEYRITIDGGTDILMTKKAYTATTTDHKHVNNYQRVESQKIEYQRGGTGGSRRRPGVRTA